MSTLLLVRHGQASLFSDNYDRLSEQGVRQAELLAESWLAEGIVPDRVWCGTLERQQRSAEAAGAVFAAAGEPWPRVEVDEHFNEFPAEELLPRILDALRHSHPELAVIAADYQSADNDAARYRHFHRLLEAVMAHWVAGSAELPEAMTWPAFSERVRGAMRRVMRETGQGRTAAGFTSGGPIGVIVQSVLQAPHIKALELNWRIHNGSVTRYTFSGDRISLDRFNDTRHLPVGMLSYR